MQRSDVISRLEAEWERLLDHPDTAREFRDLQAVEPVLAGLRDLPHLLAVMAARSSVRDLDRHDEVLLALLRQAPARTAVGDLAARITLELLLPGVKGRHGAGLLARWEPAERTAALLAAVYEEIRAPRSPWKPAKVGAQVVGRAYQRLRPRRGAAARYQIIPSGDLDSAARCRGADEQERIHPGIELLEVLADAVTEGRLAGDKAHLIAAVRVAGLSLSEVAAQLGVSYTAAVQRLHRAEAELCRSVPKLA